MAYPARMRLVAVALSAAVLVACSTAPHVKQPTPPTANPETSYALITPPDAPHYTLQPGQSAQLPRPRARHFAPPLYPVSLAHPGTPPVVIKAQLTFGSDGKVTGVYVLSDSCAGAHCALFEHAVRVAAMGWEFTPLVFESHGDPAVNAGTLQRTARPFSLWFEFSFRMVDGNPSTVVTRRR